MCWCCAHQIPLSFFLPRIWQEVRHSEKIVSFKEHKAKLQVRFSWISKNISLQIRMEPLPKQSSKFLAAWLGPGLSVPWISRNQCEGLCLHVPAEQSTADRFAANPPRAQLPSHGATACKSVPGIHWQGEGKRCAVCYPV